MLLRGNVILEPVFYCDFHKIASCIVSISIVSTNFLHLLSIYYVNYNFVIVEFVQITIEDFGTGIIFMCSQLTRFLFIPNDYMPLE